MESTVDNPFLFFDQYLKVGIYSDLENFYDEGVEELTDIQNIDRERHLIKILHYDKEVVYSFENFIQTKVKKEIQQTIKLIENRFESKYLENEEKEYSTFLLKKYGLINQVKAFDLFEFLEPMFKEILYTINYFGDINMPRTSESWFSFQILAETPEQQYQKTEKLYTFLTTTPAFIDTTKEEFFRAFSGQPVNTGINWLVKGKNNKVNKNALFYLIESLIDHKHLSPIVSLDLHKYILYVFRDGESNKLKNLSISYSQKSSSPERKEEIDHLIAFLL